MCVGVCVCVCACGVVARRVTGPRAKTATHLASSILPAFPHSDSGVSVSKIFVGNERLVEGW